MATEVEVIVDPDSGAGTDYTSMQAALAGEVRGLVALDEICVITCRSTGGTEDTTNAVFGGAWTSDATRYVKVWTNPAEGYRPSMIRGATGNYYRLNARLYQDNTLKHIRLDGLWLRYANSGTGLAFFVSDSVVYVSNSYIRGITNGEANIYVSAGSVLRCWNTILDQVGNSGRSVTVEGAGAIAYLRAVTAMGGTADRMMYTLTGGAIHAINVLTKCATPGFPGEWDDANGSRSYCASSDGTADDLGGTGNRVSQTFTFNDEAGGDFHLAGGDGGALGFGTDLSADAQTPFSDDIDGEARGATWDIGADQYVAAGSARGAPFGSRGTAFNGGRTFMGVLR